MKQNILDMVNFSTTIEGTYHIIPQEVYPCDYEGGKGPSVKELHGEIKNSRRKKLSGTKANPFLISDLCNQQLEEYQDYFLEEEKTQRNDETQRQKKKSSWGIFS